jgi:hypothetical protein
MNRDRLRGLGVYKFLFGTITIIVSNKFAAATPIYISKCHRTAPFDTFPRNNFADPRVADLLKVALGVRDFFFSFLGFSFC